MAITTIVEPTQRDITVRRGDSFYRLVAVVDDDGAAVNLAGYTGRAQIRRKSGESIEASFSVAVNAVAGTVAVSLLASVTRDLVAGRYKWDLELDGGDSNTWTIVAGDVTVADDITEI